MADTATTNRGEWARLLDDLTKEHEGDYVTIELLDPTYGDQYEAERLPFAYITYDYRDDAVIVAVGGTTPRFPVVLRHIVSHPADVNVATGQGVDAAARVVDTNGTTTLVTFFPPPAPS